MEKAENVMLGIFFIILLLAFFFPLAVSFQGSSGSFSSDNKFDEIVGSEGTTNSTSFVQRFIGGRQPVANTTSSSLTGRLGILEEISIENFTIFSLTPENNSILENNGTMFFTYQYVNAVADNCSIILDNIINQTALNPANATILNFTVLRIPDGGHTWFVQCSAGSNVKNSSIRTFTLFTTVISSDACTDPRVCSAWSECINGQQSRICRQCSQQTTEIQSCQVCQEDWQCSVWGNCINNQRARVCSDANLCNTVLFKPAETEACISHLKIDYMPTNLNLIVPNRSTVNFFVRAEHTLSSTSLTISWIANGQQELQNLGTGVLRSSFSENFDNDGEVTARVEGGGETANIKWSIKVVETQCIEDWDCEFWSYCEDNAAFSYPSICRDLNACGTNLRYPQPRECTCSAQWLCQDWSRCDAKYSISDLINENVIEPGMQKRTCFDLIACENRTKTEYQNCSLQFNITAQKVEWCNETVVEITDNTEDILVSRLKETRIRNITRIDVSFITTKFAGYCSYCNDGLKDYDEDGIDCGGMNCPPCLRKKFFNWLLWLNLLLWITLLFLVLIYLKDRDRRKELPDIFVKDTSSAFKWLKHEEHVYQIGEARTERRIKRFLKKLRF
jgi:hypothetical protein